MIFIPINNSNIDKLNTHISLKWKCSNGELEFWTTNKCDCFQMSWDNNWNRQNVERMTTKDQISYMLKLLVFQRKERENKKKHLPIKEINNEFGSLFVSMKDVQNLDQHDFDLF